MTNTAQLEAAIWQLLEYSWELGVTVMWKDPDTCEEVWPDLWGYFDPMGLKIVCYKRKERPITIQHVHTLAHELRHAYQFKNNMCPKYWLAMLGLYPKYTNEKHSKLLEDDADAWANEFMVKNYLTVPTSFDHKLV